MDGYIDAAVGESPDPDTARTASSFGYEWTTFDVIEPEDAEYWKMYFRDVPESAYVGKVVLDAGCGKGRYTHFIAPHVRALAAVDNSVAVEAAARNLQGHANVGVLKADLRSMPFAPASFDFLSCLGVLHHLRLPEEGFHSLLRLLRPGGHLLLYLYSRPDGAGIRSFTLTTSTRLRRLTVRVPHRALRALSAPIGALLYAGFVVPGELGSRLGVKTLAKLPLDTYRGKPVRSLWLDTFDRLSAPIEHRYSAAEIEAWFAREGLELLALREEAGYFTFARKPAE